MKTGLEKLRQRIHECGLRATLARVTVLGIFESAARPLSRKEVLSNNRVTIYDRTTVMRVLNDFVRVGIFVPCESEGFEGYRLVK
jgi:Fe2+ or Zn2+ uptake regulation protein